MKKRISELPTRRESKVGLWTSPSSSTRSPTPSPAPSSNSSSPPTTTPTTKTPFHRPPSINTRTPSHFEDRLAPMSLDSELGNEALPGYHFGYAISDNTRISLASSVYSLSAPLEFNEPKEKYSSILHARNSTLPSSTSIPSTTTTTITTTTTTQTHSKPPKLTIPKSSPQPQQRLLSHNEAPTTPRSPHFSDDDQNHFISGKSSSKIIASPPPRSPPIAPPPRTDLTSSPIPKSARRSSSMKYDLPSSNLMASSNDQDPQPGASDVSMCLDSKVPLCYFVAFLISKSQVSNLLFLVEAICFQHASFSSKAQQLSKADRIYQTFLTPHSILQVNIPNDILRQAQVHFAAGRRLECLSTVALHIPAALQSLYSQFCKTKEYASVKGILLALGRGQDPEKITDIAWKKWLDTAVANLIRVFLRYYEASRGNGAASGSLSSGRSGGSSSEDEIFHRYRCMWKTIQLLCWAVFGYRRHLPKNILVVSTNYSPGSPFLSSRFDSLERNSR